MPTDFPKTLKVLVEGYHGTWDPFISLTEPAHGVPPDENMEKLDPALDEEQIKTASAVIIEPVITDNSEERIEWLKRLRALCTKWDTVLIYDEIITSFRYRKHCVALDTNILPDLICVAKAMANGLPLAAVGGKKKYMDNSYFISSTYAGEILSLASCQWSVDQLLNNPGVKIDKLWEQGARFISRFNKMGLAKIAIEGYATRGVFKGEPLIKALFFQEACKAGFLFGPSFFYSFANKDFDFEFFTFFKDFMDRLSLGVVRLEGEMPQSPFAERVRKNG